MLRIDCPYTLLARGKTNEQAKVRLSEAEYAQLFPEIAEAVMAVKSANPNFSYQKFFTNARSRDNSYGDPSYVWSLKTNAVGTRTQVVRRKTWWSRLTNLLSRNR